MFKLNFLKPQDSNVLHNALILYFIYFIYVYFFNFDSGKSYAPVYMRAVKDVIAIMIYIYFSKELLTNFMNINYRKLLTWLFILLISTTIWQTYQSGNLTYIDRLKNIIYFMPLAFLINEKIFFKFFLNFKYILYIQILLLPLIYFNYITLWEQRIFAGTLSSPNTLSLALLIYMIFIITKHTVSITTIAHFCCATTIQLFTQRTGLFFISAFILSSITVLNMIKKRRKTHLFLILYAAIFIVGTTLVLPFHTYKLRDLYETVTSPYGSIEKSEDTPQPKLRTISVTSRIDSFIRILNTAKNARPIEYLVGLSSSSYIHIDSQFLTTFANHGLLTLAILITCILNVFKTQLRLADDNEYFYFFSVLGFALSFITYSSWDYFPLNIIFTALLYLGTKQTSTLSTKHVNKINSY